MRSIVISSMCLILSLSSLAIGAAAESTNKPASQPAADQAAASQPAEGRLARYFNVVKNEFMRNEDDRIVLVPDDLRKQIEEIRLQAADEKDALDDEIADLTGEIGASDAARRNSEKAARDQARKAREAQRKSVRYEWQVSGGRYSSQTYRDGYEDYKADRARDQADAHKSKARSAKGDVSSARSRLMDLKRRAAQLASVASPNNRNLPPRTYWRDLPDDVQKQLARVGITLDEFKAVLRVDLRLTEEAFIKTAVELDQKTRTAADLADELREFFKGRMGEEKKQEPPAAKPGAKQPRTPAPAGNSSGLGRG